MSDQTDPSEQLLDKVEEIATIKRELSAEDCSLASAGGLYVQSGSVSGGVTQYMAGGKFVSALVFMKTTEGSRKVKKYKPGHWEDKVDEVLLLCRELKQVYDAQENWDFEKRAAYDVSETANFPLFQKFCTLHDQHCSEPLKQLNSEERLHELNSLFLEELKKEWPREHFELRMINSPENEPKELWLAVVKAITVAYVAGDMYGRSLISQEVLVNATLSLGDVLEGVVKRNFKRARSKGVAFATSLMRISTMGIIDSRAVAVGKITQPLSSREEMVKPQVSRAEVLEEMFKLPETFSVGLIPSKKGFTGAEANVIISKVNPLIVGAFPVKDEANENQINEWLKHPLINCPLPDELMMSVASHTPMPVEMAERILRTLLEEKYDTYWGMAEERLRSSRK